MRLKTRAILPKQKTMKTKYTKQQILESIKYWKKQLNIMNESGENEITKLDSFILELIFALRNLSTEFHVMSDASNYQWLNIDYSSVDHNRKVVRLGATMIEDDPPGKYLSTLESLVSWLKANKVGLGYTVIFEDCDSNEYTKADIRHDHIILY